MDINKLNLTIEQIKRLSEQNKDFKDINNEIENIILNIKRASYKKDTNKLAEKINKIKDTYIMNWEIENIPFIENIIKNLDTNNGIPLPILSICGQGTQEIRFTKYLSYFLDPKRKHGLKDKLLNILLSPECNLLGLDSSWSKNCNVIPEIKLGEIQEKDKIISCFADIGIEGKDYIIVIEQKILSKESKHPDSDINQLERYNMAIDNNTKYKDKKKVKIYLTPEGDYKKESFGWISLTHEELIYRSIKLLKLNNISKVSRENLIRLLMDLAMGPYEILEESLEELLFLGNELVSNGFNLSKIIKFNKIKDKNKQVIDILMEG